MKTLLPNDKTGVSRRREERCSVVALSDQQRLVPPAGEAGTCPQERPRGRLRHTGPAGDLLSYRVHSALSNVRGRGFPLLQWN